jgi:ribulose-phosphate 3-epimerase
MVVPALLTDKKEELQSMLDLCAKFTDFAQIDIMDGDFVPSKSITAEELKFVRAPIGNEAHLMVKDPLTWLEPFKALGCSRIIYHFEALSAHERVIREIRRHGFKVGLAVKPQTKLSEFKALVPLVDCLLFMSVNPGFYGAPFIPDVLNGIKEFKKAFPDKIAGIDGGVKKENLQEIIESGVDYVCVGSAILKAQDPQAAYRELLVMTKQAYDAQ